MKNYYRVILGRSNKFADQCFAGDFIGADFGIAEDLTGKLPNEWRDFNKQYIPVWLAGHPGKSKIAAGLSCGFLWTVCKGINNGDVVLCPDGSGFYRLCEVVDGYRYAPGSVLPHRRPVHWTGASIERSTMSDALKNSTGLIGTVCDISGYREELEKLMGGLTAPKLIVANETIEDPSAFAMEAHLEAFLVENWASTELGRNYDIYEDEGELVGQQYQTMDAGRIDILAISKDKKRFLVIELKRGRASDKVVGQALRYMGYVKEEIAEEGQTVEGAIIALENDIGIKRALSILPNVAFYRYQVDFKLLKS